jgi:hypothetical protein
METQATHLWARSRSGSHAGRGFRYQDAVATELALRGLNGELPLRRIVPEGLADISVELKTGWLHLQAKSRREHRGEFPLSELTDAWPALAERLASDPQARAALVLELPYEKVLDVLPGLARGDDFSGCLTAMLMAAVDLGQSGALTGDAADIESALLTHAEAAYSIPRGKPAAARASELASTALAAIPEDARHQLCGPYWRSRAEVTAMRSAASATAEGDFFTIADDGRLVAWSGH